MCLYSQYPCLTTTLLQVEVIETYPQLIDFDLDVYEYFKTQYVFQSALDWIVRYLKCGNFPDDTSADMT
jgi:hypothetical protein